MVACANASRPVSVRCSHSAGAKFSYRALHLHLVLGHSYAEASVAGMETSSPHRRDFSGAHAAYHFLRAIRPSLRGLGTIVLRPVASQTSAHPMARTS